MHHTYCGQIDTTYTEEANLLHKSSDSPLKQPKKTTLGINNLKTHRKQIYKSLSRQSNTLTPKQHQELIENLERSINDCLDQPIEILEEKLYEICCKFSIDLQSQTPKSEIIEIFHLVNVMQHLTNDTSKLSTVLMELQEVSTIYIKSYEFICEFIKLVNDLCLIYGIIDIYNYKVLFDVNIEKLRAINVKTLFNDLVNMEVIWMSYISMKPPLKHVLNDETKMFAKILQEELWKTLDVMMGIGMKTDDKLDVSERKNDRFIEEYGFRRRLTTSGVLRSKGLFSRIFKCFRGDDGYRRAELQEQLRQFEYTYRVFECTILKTWFEIESLNVYVL